MVPFLLSIWQATVPVLKICIIALAGAAMAHAGILDQKGKHTLSKMVYYCFNPALSFSKLAPVLTAQHIAAWMPLAINIFMSVAVGLLMGRLLVAVVKPPAGLRRHVLAASALGNTGNLPLVLTTALVSEGAGLLAGQGVTVDLAVAYVSMANFAATMCLFTVGTYLLKPPPEQKQQENEEQQQQQPVPVDVRGDTAINAGSGVEATRPGATADKMDACREGQPELQKQEGTPGKSPLMSSSDGVDTIKAVRSGSPPCGALEPAVLQRTSSCDKSDDSNEGPTAGSGGAAATVTVQQKHDHRQQQYECCEEVCEKVPLFSQQQGSAISSSDGCWQQQQQQRRQEHGTLPGATVDNPGLTDSSTVSAAATRQMQPRELTSALISAALGHTKALAAAAGSVLWQCSNANMLALLLALLVGLSPPIKAQLFSSKGSLLMVQDCINMFGACNIPCLLLMLGAILSKGPGCASPPFRVIAGTAVTRLLLLPLLGTCWSLLVCAAGWMAAPDKLFLLVMLLQNAVPTALNVQTLATLYANRVEETGALLFWQYLAACITLPVVLTLHMWLLQQPFMDGALTGSRIPWKFDWDWDLDWDLRWDII